MAWFCGVCDPSHWDGASRAGDEVRPAKAVPLVARQIWGLAVAPSESWTPAADRRRRAGVPPTPDAERRRSATEPPRRTRGSAGTPKEAMAGASPAGRAHRSPVVAPDEARLGRR